MLKLDYEYVRHSANTWTLKLYCEYSRHCASTCMVEFEPSVMDPSVNCLDMARVTIRLRFPLIIEPRNIDYSSLLNLGL